MDSDLPRVTPYMNHEATLPAAPSLNQGDIYFILFRHKSKILLCALAGVVAAAAMYILDAPPYQSDAKLFVRYIISDNKALGPSGSDGTAKSPDQRGETIMKSETEILTSMDLAKRVAESIGPEKILAKVDGGNDLNTATAVIKGGLSAFVAPSSTVITVSFRHPDPEVVQPVLREVIERYFKLHVETHTANGMLGDFLTRETDQLKSRLARTEDELRRATISAGIISLEDAKSANSAQLTAIRRDLFAAQAEIAQRTAVLQELNKRFPSKDAEDDEAIPHDVLAQYRSVSQQIELLQGTERELLTQFTSENARVKDVGALLKHALATRSKLEERHPRLVQIGLGTQHASEGGTLDAASVATQITALEAKVAVLTHQLEEIKADAAKIDQMEGTIVDLRRRKELEEANYRYYSASLEQSRINETLGNGRISNLNQIQAPSPPVSDRTKSNKTVGLLAGGGLFVGIIWAFLIELYFDRTVKRPVDVERSLRAPLFIAIPALRRKQLKGMSLLALTSPAQAALPEGKTAVNGANGSAANGSGAAPSRVPTAEAIHPLQLFHETLRDRLIGYFESIGLTHKPKLVAVTGLIEGAGVTTTASGLARSLSETCEGNVLLVNMNVSQGAAFQFSKGKAVPSLDELLDAPDVHAGEKLVVVVEAEHSERLSRNMPQRFSKLVPKLKTSDFDYIIFDMPPVSQISITPRLAGFMDMVLMVVESEKTDRDLVQRATALLVESHAHVGIVLNKMKRYVPARLFQDNLAIS